MATFPLKVMTVEQCCFDGEVDRIIVRTTQGDVGILPNHVPYIAALGIGGLTVFQNGSKRTAMIAGGFVEVSAEGTVLLTRTCEWADEIDVSAAKEAAEQARKALAEPAQRRRARKRAGRAEKSGHPHPHRRRKVNRRRKAARSFDWAAFCIDLADMVARRGGFWYTVRRNEG